MQTRPSLIGDLPAMAATQVELSEFINDQFELLYFTLSL